MTCGAARGLLPRLWKKVAHCRRDMSHRSPLTRSCWKPEGWTWPGLGPDLLSIFRRFYNSVPPLKRGYEANPHFILSANLLFKPQFQLSAQLLLVRRLSENEQDRLGLRDLAAFERRGILLSSLFEGTTKGYAPTVGILSTGLTSRTLLNSIA